MRKTFALRPEGKHPDRVLDAVRHDIRQYMKRERRKPLPEGSHFWDFDCRLGVDEGSAQALHPGELLRQIDALAQAGATQCFVVLLAKPAVRKWRPRPEEGSEAVGTDGALAVPPSEASSDDDRAAV